MPEVAQLGGHGAQAAIVEPGEHPLSYGELDVLIERVAGILHHQGVRPGARIGICLPRSVDAIAAILGVVRAGCTYVPVDPAAPAERAATIMADCGVAMAFVDVRLHKTHAEALAAVMANPPLLQSIQGAPRGAGIAAWTSLRVDSETAPREGDRDDLACILYTSGTTARPKGWMMNRDAIASHVTWARTKLRASELDVFANHAQFTFGMSLFDIFTSLTCGARLVLIPDAIRQHGVRILKVLADERVSILFAGPTVLSLIAQALEFEVHDLSNLRILAFAGEVFPVRYLNDLRNRLRGPRYFNFYGSTEANVAVYSELPGNNELATSPPIGRPCEHYEARVVKDGLSVAAGTTGELQLRGAGLSSGYWNDPELTKAKTVASDDGGLDWFRTGDLVVERDKGELHYVGRIGRMVKLRGYRIEPGEIEARLYEHPSVREVGVVLHQPNSGPELVAHLSTLSGIRIATIELKTFCAGRLPAYMIPARFQFHQKLPRTSSGKVDLQLLRATC